MSDELNSGEPTTNTGDRKVPKSRGKKVKEKEVRRSSAPIEQVRPADRARIDAFVKQFKRSKKIARTFELENPTPGEVLYLLSLIPDYQRPFKTARYKVLLRELRREDWCAYNGDNLCLKIGNEGQPELYDGQTRCSAFWTFSQEGGKLPEVLLVYITEASAAYRTVDAGDNRSVTDVGHSNKRPRVAGGARAGILYEMYDFTTVPRMSSNEKDQLTFSDLEMVEFIRSLPQSSGRGGMQKLAYGGVFAAAVRAWRIDPEGAELFFRALIKKEHTLPNKRGVYVKINQLRTAIQIFEQYAPAQLRGQPGLAFAAYVGMMAFQAWYENRALLKKYLRPPSDGVWPSRILGVPLPRDYGQDSEAAE